MQRGKFRKRQILSTTFLYFYFLTAVFIFAQPYSLTYSVWFEKHLENIEEDTLYSIESINSGSIYRQLSLLLLGGISIIIIFRRHKNIITINGSLGLLIIFYLFWAVLSIYWSHDISLTLRRIGALLILSMSALAFSKLFSKKDIVSFTFFSGNFALWLGLCCEIILGTFRPFDSTYRFSGLMQPIYIAILCSMVIISGISLLRNNSKKSKKILVYILIGCAFSFIILTKARGPFVALNVSVLVYYTLIPTRINKIVPLVILIFLGILLFFMLGENFIFTTKKMALLGRSQEHLTTLTGRIPVWQACSEYVTKRPFLGYGYNSFWIPSIFENILEITNFPSPDTHNAYLDILLGIGIPGICMFILILIVSIKRSVYYFKYSGNVFYAFTLCMLLIFSINIFLLSTHFVPQCSSFIIMMLLSKLAFIK